MRVYSPLTPEHPAIGTKCWVCGRGFQPGERTMLKAYQTPEEAGSMTVEARIVHATCGLRGLEFPGLGIIESVKDGDASPFEVSMTNGRQYKLSELELD